MLISGQPSEWIVFNESILEFWPEKFRILDFLHVTFFISPKVIPVSMRFQRIEFADVVDKTLTTFFLYQLVFF